jgi:guanyl-specific ribonuclease Sa
MGWRPVVAAYSNAYAETVYVRFVASDTTEFRTIRTNRIHPFFVVRESVNRALSTSEVGFQESHNLAGVGDSKPVGDWITAAHLMPGDQLLQANGLTANVVDVSVTAEPLTAYNLAVADFQTYFVSSDDSDVSSVWVHNTCPTTVEAGNRRQVLEFIRSRNGAAPPGYRGNKKFENDGRAGSARLPSSDSSGQPITYRRYDIHPARAGVGRGEERIVVGSDGRAWYTRDHYRSFELME